MNVNQKFTDQSPTCVVLFEPSLAARGHWTGLLIDANTLTCAHVQASLIQLGVHVIRHISKKT